MPGPRHRGQREPFGQAAQGVRGLLPPRSPPPKSGSASAPTAFARLHRTDRLRANPWRSPSRLLESLVNSYRVLPSHRLPVDLITKGTLADSWTARFEGDATYCSSQAIAGYHMVRTGSLPTRPYRPIDRLCLRRTVTDVGPPGAYPARCMWATQSEGSTKGSSSVAFSGAPISSRAPRRRPR